MSGHKRPEDPQNRFVTIRYYYGSGVKHGSFHLEFWVNAGVRPKTKQKEVQNDEGFQTAPGSSNIVPYISRHKVLKLLGGINWTVIARF